MFCLCIFSRKENRAPVEVYVFYLNPYKLPDPAAQLIYYLKHQLVFVIVDRVEELLKLLFGEVPYYLAETFIFSRVFAFCIAGGDNLILAIFHLHPKVKSPEFINLLIKGRLP